MLQESKLRSFLFKYGSACFFFEVRGYRGPDRSSYLPAGDTVNLASRLRGLTRDMGEGMILSKATRTRLREDFPLKSLTPTKVKGKSEPLEIFSVA